MQASDAGDQLFLAYSKLNHDTSKTLSAVDFVDTGRLKEYISYKLVKITNNTFNAGGNNAIKLDIQITRLKKTQSQLAGKPFLVKIIYNGGKEYVSLDSSKTPKILNTQTNLGFTQPDELTYIRPRKRHTLYIELYKIIEDVIWPNLGTQSNVSIHDVQLINYSDNEDTYLNENDEFFFDRNQLPTSVSGNINSTTNLNFDIYLKEEKLYQYAIRVFTNIAHLPYIDIPYNIMCTNVDVESIIKLDSNDFYVRNNKYFLSLMKLVPKNRKIRIKNTSNVPVLVEGMSFEIPTNGIGLTELEAQQVTKAQFPYELSASTTLELNIEFLGREYGNTTGFIILHTNMGEVYLPIVMFVNSKLKDCMVLMENKRGVEFTSPLNAVDHDFLKFINFGDDLSLTEIQKLGYNKDEFLVENNVILYPNTESYIQTTFVPTSSGKKIGWLDVKIKDMIETFTLTNTDQSKSYKLQNTHIIAELLGTAYADHALP